MKTSRRTLWLMPLTALVFFGAAFVTLRAAGQAAQQQVGLGTQPAAAAGGTGRQQSRYGAQPAAAVTSQPKRPAPSTPEESATIADDPVTAPDPSQSADNDISFPTDI
jgi:hypothetical protein